jgi:hypothetical protein
MAKAGGAKRKDVAAASLFTTQSVRAISRKIRRQLEDSEPNFVLGTGGERTVFPLATVSSVTWSRQISTAPTFSTGALVLPLLAGVGTVAFGTYESPDYEDAAKVIPAVGTRTWRDAAAAATFLVSEGATTIDPDGAAPLFETPTSIVPEDLAFIP